MTKTVHIAIIYNEPTIETDNGRQFAFDAGVSHPHSGVWVSAARADGKIDLSEVGVIEEKEDIQSALRLLGYETSIFNMSDDLDRFPCATANSSTSVADVSNSSEWTGISVSRVTSPASPHIRVTSGMPIITALL